MIITDPSAKCWGPHVRTVRPGVEYQPRHYARVTTDEIGVGDWLWADDDQQHEVVQVEEGIAGGWRYVIFTDCQSVGVSAHQLWDIVQTCSAFRGPDPASGCDKLAQRGEDYCTDHRI